MRFGGILDLTVKNKMKEILVLDEMYEKALI